MLKRFIYICLLCIACLPGYADRYTLSVSTQGGPASWSIYGIGDDHKVEAGKTVTIELYDCRNYEFVGWLEDGVPKDYGRKFRYTMPAHDVNLVEILKLAPVLPGDPGETGKEEQEFGTKHALILTSSPGVAWFSISGGSLDVAEGCKRTIKAGYDGYAYKFVGWMMNGKIVSTDNPYEFVMGTEDVTLVAVYEFSPTTPPDPSENFWDAESGELVIDRFEAGNLCNQIYKANDYRGMVSLTISGEMYTGENKELANGYWIENDFEVFNEWNDVSNSLTTVDLSRTYGYDNIPGNIFCNSEGRFSALEKVVLPPTIKYIDGNAFSNCSSLTELRCYAKEPPLLGGNVFNGVSEFFTVYVPAESLELYQSAIGWKDLDIVQMVEEGNSIQINLPDGSSDGRYKGMTLKLVNENDESQAYSYVITDRVSYVYSNLVKKNTYKAQLLSKQGVLLSEITGISLSETIGITTTVAFTDVKGIYNPKIHVRTPNGKDVTEDVTINWMDNAGKHLKQGNSVTGIVQGTHLFYTLTLSETLGRQYLLPSKMGVDIDNAQDAEIIYTLESIPTKKLYGKVVDAEGKGLENAVVTVSQNINNLYSQSSKVKVGADGTFVLGVMYGTLPSGETWGDVSVDVSADNYVSQSREIAQTEVTDEQSFTLRSITGAVITTKLSFQKSVEASQPAQREDGYSDYENVTYTIYNITKDKEINDFNVQYPNIVLLENVDNGDEIRITAISKKDEFNCVSANTKIEEKNSKQQAVADILIIGRGGIKCDYVTTDNARVVAVLFDADGNFVKKTEYDGEHNVEFADLHDGQYTVVSMAHSDVFNDFSKYSALEDAGLKDYTDYMMKTCTVKSGIIKSIEYQVIPFFDETKVYYTGANTSFTSNKSTVTAGNTIILKGTVDFKDKYKDGEITDVCMIIDLPQSFEYVAGSMMVGAKLADSYTVNDHRLIIQLDEDYTKEVRMCAVPLLGGDYAPSAYIQFMYQGRKVLQPIGSTSVNVKDLSIYVPGKTSRAKVAVSGTAKGGAEVTIYDGNVVVGKTTAKANGSWSTIIDLGEPEQLSWHSIYGKVVKGEEQLQTETKRLQYDEDCMLIEEVHMYHGNPELQKTYDIKFDFQNPNNHPGYYTYYIFNKQFSFTVSVQGNACEEMTLNVHTAKGKIVSLPVTFDERTQKYFASGEFGDYYNGDLPVNVSITECSLGTVQSNNRDCTFGIDPSGYIYEAVRSNRVAGVTATIYYRQDENSPEELWDATEYEQENPIITDNDGMYRWDVPEGQWQVRLEKDGYTSTQSEWLPVPPPQLDINLPMVNPAAPMVKSVSAFAGEKGADESTDENGAVEIEFDKYMKVSSLTAGNIYITRNGVVAMADTGFTYPDIEEEDGIYYARKVRVPANVVFLTTDNVQLAVTTGVESYAGTHIEQTYTQQLDITKEVKAIVVDNVNVLYDPYSQEAQTAKAIVSVSPADAGIGKVLRAVSASGITATVTEQAELDANGQAELTVTGLMPGFTTLSFTIDGETVTGTCNVNVSRNARKVAAPVATKATGTAVYNNSSIVLTTTTEGASIYYTIDGSEPYYKNQTDMHGILYEKPILMDGAKTIKAVAVAKDYDDSDMKTFVYTIKQAEAAVELSKGWNWMSHNLEGTMSVENLDQNTSIYRLLSPTEELIRDPEWGLVGNLMELTNDMSYKVYMSENGQIDITGNAANALSTPIPLKSGWNWIGYPVNQVTSLDEAFSYAQPSDGDKIVNLEGGMAEYDGMKWSGNLQSLTPGQGYRYYANNAFTFMYNTNLVSKAKSLNAVKSNAIKTPWTCDKHKYADVMCVVADVYENDTKVEAGTYYVAAFCGDECRGIGQYVDGKLMMSVHGKTGDVITFRAVPQDTQTELRISETATFGNTVYGTLRSPFTFSLNGVTGIYNVSVDADDSADKCYDLSGRRVDIKSAKGIVIRNGNKIIKR